MKKKNCKNGNKDLYNKDINININTKSFDKLSLALSRLKNFKATTDEQLKEMANDIMNEAIRKKPILPLQYSTKPSKFYPFVPSDLGIDDDYDHLSFSPTAWINNTSFDMMFEEAKRKHEAGEPIGEFFPFVPSDLPSEQLEEWNPVGVVTDWKINIPEEKKKQKFPKLGESRSLEVNYTIEDPDFCQWLQDIARSNETIPLNPEDDPRLPKNLFPNKKGIQWVIDDLVPEDTILCFDKRNVIFGVDKDGKEYVKLRNKKNFKKISLKKEENKK